MADLKQAAEQAQKLIQMLGGVRDIADALVQLGSYEQAIGEVKTRHGLITNQVAELSAQLQTKKAELEQANADAQSIRDKANADALAIATDARTKAETLVTEARVQADATIKNAEQRVAELNAHATHSQALLAKANVEHAAAVAEHKRVTDLVAQIKGA